MKQLIRPNKDPVEDELWGDIYDEEELEKMEEGYNEKLKVPRSEGQKGS